MIRFASLGSGSKGNATLVETGQTRILIDCGFSLAETTKRLARLNCSPESINAILVTHEHGDHANGVGRLSRKYKIPVYLTHGSYLAMKDTQFFHFHAFNTHCSFSIQDFNITPLAVPHDAREPSQFIFSDGDKRLVLLTDLGYCSPFLIEQLAGLDGLMLECNYDLNMLRYGNYPPSLKKRVLSNHGHLDNQDATSLLKRLDTQALQHIVGMHISENNNTDELAKAALVDGLLCANEDVILANQKTGFDWLTIQ